MILLSYTYSPGKKLDFFFQSWFMGDDDDEEKGFGSGKELLELLGASSN